MKKLLLASITLVSMSLIACTNTSSSDVPHTIVLESYDHFEAGGFDYRFAIVVDSKTGCRYAVNNGRDTMIPLITKEGGYSCNVK